MAEVPVVPGAKVVCQHCPRTIHPDAGRWAGADGNYDCRSPGGMRAGMSHKPMPQVGASA